eukprot:2942054-Prorocentrum_lima.AAC.1
MTSSLVGSEMCIRDRPSPQQPRGPTSSSSSTFIGRSPISPTGQLGAGAVSYTHLTLPTICSV